MIRRQRIDSETGGRGVSVGHTFGALTWLIVGVSTVALYPVFALFALAPITQTWIYLRPRLSKEAHDGPR